MCEFSGGKPVGAMKVKAASGSCGASFGAASTDLGEEVHIAEGGRAAPKHFGSGEGRAIGNEFRIHEAPFEGPDALLEPGAQGHVIGKAPE